MKKSKLTLLLALSLIFSTFFACGSDDDESGIVGSWVFTRVDAVVKTNDQDATTLINDDIKDRYPGNDMVNLTFQDDGVLISESGGKTTYTYVDGVLHFSDKTYYVDLNSEWLGLSLDIKDYYTPEKLIELEITNSNVVVEKAQVVYVFFRK